MLNALITKKMVEEEKVLRLMLVIMKRMEIYEGIIRTEKLTTKDKAEFAHGYRDYLNTLKSLALQAGQDVEKIMKESQIRDSDLKEFNPMIKVK